MCKKRALHSYPCDTISQKAEINRITVVTVMVVDDVSDVVVVLLNLDK